MRDNTLFSLNGKQAQVTGASGRIGLALARSLERHGAKIVLNARHPETLVATRAMLAAEGVDATCAPFDVTDQDGVIASVEKVARTRGPIDILINNACIQRRAPLDPFTRTDRDVVIATNLNAVFFVGRAVARHMLPRGRGKIVNICSVPSELARPGIAPYTATKGAVRTLTRGMATDRARHGLQVNGLTAGYFRTEMTEKLVADTEFTGWLCQRMPGGAGVMWRNWWALPYSCHQTHQVL